MKQFPKLGKWAAGVIASIALTYTISKADAKIKQTVKQSSKTRYWSANLKGQYVDIGRPLTFNQAVAEVATGRNVFTVTWYEAAAVARAAGGKTGANNTPLPREIHGGGKKGYYWHYHTYNRKGGHVYYLF